MYIFGSVIDTSFFLQVTTTNNFGRTTTTTPGLVNDQALFWTQYYKAGNLSEFVHATNELVEGRNTIIYLQ